MMAEFHEHGRIPKGGNASFIVLIPKVEGASDLNQFRPISLIGCTYKIIAKVLARRLKPIMGSIISETQTAFVSDRNILDGVVILNEIIEDAKKRKAKRLLLKVDFAKAYDSIDWNFLLDMMARLNFPEKWRIWIKECVSTATANVLVNGSPSGEFHLQRGVRQGDPLSPFLFLIVAEGLSLLMERAVDRGLIRPIDVGKDRIKITHLQYADDTMIIMDGSEENARAVKWILKLFEMVSGLSINFDKCCAVGINMDEEEEHSLVDILECRGGSLPLDYLGMRVGGGLSRTSNWDGLVDKIRKKVLGWNGRKVSLGGRVTLLKSVIAAIPTYRMAFSFMPAAIAKKIKTIMCNFMWGGGEGGSKKIAWLRWDEVCKTKMKGGLAIRNLQWFNMALMGKWWWRFLREKNRLWTRVIKSRHGDLVGDVINGCEERPSRTVVGWWRKVVAKMKDDVGKGLSCKFRRVVGGGSETGFWKDKWCGGSSLSASFPRLYRLSANRMGVVSDMGSWENGRWVWDLKWRRRLNEREMEEIDAILECIATVSLKEGESDEWRWGEVGKGYYSVKEAYSCIAEQKGEMRDTTCAEVVFRGIWNSAAPFKQQVMAWRTVRNRLPTRDNLLKRMDLSSEGSLCPCCAMVVESAAHLLLRCRDMDHIWNSMVRWIGVEWTAPADISAHFVSFSRLGRGKKLSQILGGLWVCVIWVMWRWRNKILFEAWEWNCKRIEEEIRRRMWSWCASKGLVDIAGNFLDWNRQKLIRFGDHG